MIIKDSLLVYSINMTIYSKTLINARLTMHSTNVNCHESIYQE